MCSVKQKKGARVPIRSRNTPSPPSLEVSSLNVTSAVGMEETSGYLRAKRRSLFTQTVIWVTALVCVAFLLASLAQAWSNSQLMGQVQAAQRDLQQAQSHHDALAKQANYYKDPFVIESEARQQLGYVRPGEHAVIIISSTDPSQQHTARVAKVTAPSSYWQEWWNIFFGG